MKALLLFPFKVLWFLIKMPFKILGFMCKNTTVKTGSWRK